MKQTPKLITLVLLALALNAVGKPLEAKALPIEQPSNREAATASTIQHDPSTIQAISFIGLSSLNQEELINSLPLKVKESVSGTELTGALQYLWQLHYFSDVKVEKIDLGQNNVALQFIVTELPVLEFYSSRQIPF